MKKLIMIFLLLSTSIAFAGWDGWGDPSHFKVPIEFDSVVTFNDDIYVKDTTFHGGAVIDSGNHVILGRLTAGDTTTAVGGIVHNPSRMMLEVWRDTIGFMCWSTQPFPHYSTVKPYNMIYTEEEQHGGALVLQGWANGSGIVVIRSDECKPDTNDVVFFRAQIYPGLDTFDYWSGGPGYSHLGDPVKRWGESWIMYQCQTDASRADTSKRWMGADTLYHESENPNKFDNDVLVDGELTSNGVTQFPYVDLDIDDTEEYELTVADGKAGWGMASMEAEWTFFRFTAAGVVTLVNNTANVTTTDGTNDNFNIFDSGTTITFENQLGDNKELNINVWFTP